MRKYFEAEEQRLKDLLRSEKLWAKEKEEAEELSKRMVSGAKKQPAVGSPDF